MTLPGRKPFSGTARTGIVAIMADPNPAPLKPGDHLFLIDGSSYIFRAYHALPPLTRRSDQLPIGAVAGFCNMLWRLLREGDETANGLQPSHFAVIFDASGPTFRNHLYTEYKANRPDVPEDLRPQFGLIRQAVRAFNIAAVEMQGFEADDLIATYSRQAVEAGANVTIIGSDKDLMQLIQPGVVMVDTMKNKRISDPQVAEKFGVAPNKVIEVQALAGDAVDNIPGVPGIGVKTAALLINEYGDLESLLARAGEIKQNKRRENLLEFADQARLSRDLVELKQDVPVTETIDDFAVIPLDGVKALAFLKAMGFTTLTRRVATVAGVDVDDVAPGEVEVSHWPQEGMELAATAGAGDAAAGDATPADGAQAAHEEVRAAPAIGPSSYETVTTLEELDRWIAEAEETGYVAVDTETTSLDAMQADLVGISLATAPGRACYIPLTHRQADDLLAGGGLIAGQIDIDAALARLKPMLENPGILKIAQNLKYDWLVLIRYGIEVAPFDDTMLLSYALDAGRGGNGMDELSQRWLDHKPIPFKEVAGSGKSALTFDLIPLEPASAYAAEDADVTLRLWMVLKPRLAGDAMTTVYELLERNLVPVLARMEQRGITVDRQILARLSGDFAQRAASLEADIHELAGEKFNAGSPKQLGEILFGKMGLPGGRKTKTGAWSTSAQILEELAASGHELPRAIVDWRQLTKLKSTYTDALQSFIHPQTGRVHTSYSLASTTTGRLSSSDPNLQNIPVRTEEGRKIRTAFVAPAGYKLLSADYSQIELRLLAHIADIERLRQAFADGLDIHALTAAEMFNVPVEGMDPSVRRRAKAINFGIIYGISAFGLANQLGIGRSEARDYIETYFARFPGIRDYMEATKTFCRSHGYVETIFGRKAHYPEINNANPNHRAFTERAAINAPIQGSAADIIRRAMCRMEAALADAGLKTDMLLQVHDELIFEVPNDQVEATIPVVRRVMEEAPMPALSLRVPLMVDARAADNWDEAH
jgi:DNA polymerase-1